MPTLEIYGVPQSNFVWTARIACAEKGVPCELKLARPHTPDIDAIHPMGRMPVMRHGEDALFETIAICVYVDRVFQGPGLIPAGAMGAADMHQWVSFINTSLDPVCQRQYGHAYMFPGTPDGSPNRAKIEASLPGVEKHLGIVDKAVAKTGYLSGAAFTLADAFLMPILVAMTKRPESAAIIEKLPTLKAYIARHLARPSVASTMPPPPPPKAG